MECRESGSNDKQSVGPLISGLPDDIALFCLGRVPRKYHAALKCVSRRWRDLLQSEEWCAYRRKHNLDETWIYTLCKDNKLERVCCYVLDPNSTRRSWRLICEPPSRALRRKGMGFEVLGKNAYLLGGCGWSEDATREVYCYDAARNTWIDSAPLSTARSYTSILFYFSEVTGAGQTEYIQAFCFLFSAFISCSFKGLMVFLLLMQQIVAEGFYV